jgi:hypothetical protein
MKKIILLTALWLGVSGMAIGQQHILTKKEARQVLEKAWNAVKNNDSASFASVWILDESQWPYHGGAKFTPHDVQLNFWSFKKYFDEPLAKGMKIASVECDTLKKDDPHYEYAKYYIKAWFKISDTYSKGFGFYMDYVNDKWGVRYSPDYSQDTKTKK